MWLVRYGARAEKSPDGTQSPNMAEEGVSPISVVIESTVSSFMGT